MEYKNNSKISVILYSIDDKSLMYECILSIFNQKFKNFELIYVQNTNDKNFIDFANSFLFYKIIIVKCDFLTNNPYNIGLKAANGEYVCFMTPYMILNSNCLNDIYTYLKGKNTEFLVSINETHYNMFSFNYDQNILNFEDKLNFLLINICKMFFLCAKRTLTHNKINFNSNLIGFYHDELFFIKTVMFAKNISFLNNNLFTNKYKPPKKIYNINFFHIICDQLENTFEFLNNSKVKTDFIFSIIYKNSLQKLFYHLKHTEDENLVTVSLRIMAIITKMDKNIVFNSSKITKNEKKMFSMFKTFDGITTLKYMDKI